MPQKFLPPHIRKNKLFRWDETSYTTPKNICSWWCAGLCLPTTWSPLKSILYVFLKVGCCVSASLGWCRTQDNILFQSMSVVFRLSAFSFLFFFYTSSSYPPWNNYLRSPHTKDFQPNKKKKSLNFFLKSELWKFRGTQPGARRMQELVKASNIVSKCMKS
jgi:hypothetical protein